MANRDEHIPEEKQAPPPRKRRKWLRRVLWTFLGLILLLALFHRPIIFEGTRYFVVRAAKQQKLDLTYEMRGSIFTTLSVINLKAVPTEPGPIQRLELGTLNLRYSLIDLVRDGLPAFLKEVDVRDVFVELTPGEPLPPEKEEKPQSFKFPALFPELLNLANVNLIVHAPTGDTVVEGFFFSLLPDRPGVLKIQTLDIPGVRRWTDIRAETTFRERNLLLTGLVVGPEIALRTFNLDLTKLESDEVGVLLDGTFFNAPTNLNMRVTDLNETNQFALKLDLNGLEFDPVWKYLNLAGPVQGRLEKLSVDLKGKVENPGSWAGKARVELRSLAQASQKLGDVNLDAVLGQGRADIALSDRLDEVNAIKLTTGIRLPEKFEDFPKTEADGLLTVALPELARLALPEGLAGDLTLETKFHLAAGRLVSQTKIDSTRLAVTGAEATDTHFILEAEKNLDTPPDAPLFQTLLTRLDGGIAKVRFQDYEAEALSLALGTQDAEVKLEHLTLSKAANTVRLGASYILPADMKSWLDQPAKLDLAVDAPDLAAFLAPDSGVDLKGKLKITGQAEAESRVLKGNFLIEGREISAQGLPIRTVDANVAVADNQVRITQLQVVLDDKNRLQADGEVLLGEKLKYQGKLEVNLDDLSLFQPLLGGTTLKGKLVTKWEGRGDATTPEHFGTASLDLTGGQFGEQKDLTAHFKADYTPEYINLPDFIATAGELGQATLSLFWKENRLAVTHLAVQQKKLKLLEGTIDLPLHLAAMQDVAQLLPADEPLNVSLKTKDLNLRTLFTQMGQKDPPVIGTVNLDLTAQGTIDELQARLAFRATGLQSTAAAEVAPADVSLDLNVQNDRAVVDGMVRQKLIEPLRITGNLPFDLEAITKARAIDPQTPVDLRVSLPRSSLAFVSTLVPMVRQSRGTATVDVRVGGTIASPNFAGNISADLSALRFTDPSLPPIDSFGLRLDFTRDRVNIARCSGGIAGGSFSAGGNITFARLDNPVFDLRIGAKEALVLQNDDLTVRVNSDIRVTGPMNAGTVRGNVWVTRSRFFRNIDILPIGLPGRPAPQPPAEPVVITFPKPPLRDWKFDVAIRTADPFLVQSNLATGRIVINLHVGGTGLEPWMEGSVNIERLVASLPFSRLQIDQGIISFNRRSPFIPQLNLQGTSTIRDYAVTVFITGPITAPDALFTSDPPLPQAEVVSLLATGMTTTELGRNPNALAGRAVILLFQKAYNSVFRRNRPPPENDSFLSRIQFDIGTTDPKTGRQSTTLGIPLSDRIMLTGGLDVGGNFRGQVKYLVRFK